MQWIIMSVAIETAFPMIQHLSGDEAEASTRSNNTEKIKEKGKG